MIKLQSKFTILLTLQNVVKLQNYVPNWTVVMNFTILILVLIFYLQCVPILKIKSKSRWYSRDLYIIQFKLILLYY